MLNSRPNNKNYHQGLYIPVNKDKVLKLNDKGGIYYRSSLEKKMMIFLDHSKPIRMWSAESIEIPYFSNEVKNGDLEQVKRRYYPDFYYEQVLSNGEIKKVIAEVKPKSEYDDAVLLKEGKFTVPDKASIKKMQSLEYKFKMAQKNLAKWETMLEFCKMKGFEFIIITDEILKRRGL